MQNDKLLPATYDVEIAKTPTPDHPIPLDTQMYIKELESRFDRILEQLEEAEQGIRNKAIDEFALALKLKYPYFVEDVGFVEANKRLGSVIDEIAEQMKGE